LRADSSGIEVWEVDGTMINRNQNIESVQEETVEKKKKKKTVRECHRVRTGGFNNGRVGDCSGFQRQFDSQ
jgi:hypothetical protein